MNTFTITQLEVSPTIIDYLKRKKLDHMFVHDLEVNVRDLLKDTGRPTMTGMAYSVLALLIVYTMDCTLTGYGGGHTVDNLYYEAVGLSAVATSRWPHTARYTKLCSAVMDAQINNQELNDLADRMLEINTGA